ncbi:MAG: ATP-binding cassette domain-containing protein [Propionibacteriaceae bacterium]|jgi:ABC-type glutathione transport system ATPase component|nr:ATP-binding cassette domain-containing protein [Propionibacteriaceae bacterium]
MSGPQAEFDLTAPDANAKATGPSAATTFDFEVRGVSRVFKRSGGAAKSVIAVDDVSFTVTPGQRLGIVGESGSGKSTVVRMLAGLMRPSSGEILFRGEPMQDWRENQLAPLRSELQMVFQDPRSSLDPRMKVGRIISEPLRSPLIKRSGKIPDTQEARAARLTDVMVKMGLEPAMADRYPHEFSGGQRQRIAIARALAPRPSILIADEAVSALDVSVRAHVLNLIVDRVLDDGLTLLFVSHDLAVVRHVCDSVLVMKSGRIVESGDVAEVYANPQDPYTQELLASVPTIRAW